MKQDGDSAPAPPSDTLTMQLNEPASATRSLHSQPEPSAGDLSIRYAHERMLGEGAMGAVSLVRDRETGEQLALKKLFRMDARTVLRLKREFRALADLSHRNLIRVHELGRASDGWYLTMEYVAGEDLRTYLGWSDDAERFEARVVPAFRQLAEGIHALHRAGMLHRDLKPSNVMVTDHRVLVLDFGLVCELDPKAASLTEDGAINGTPAYMAPEQVSAKGLSEASDWYAYGVMLYEALAGFLPFEGTLYEVMRAKLEHEPPPLDPSAGVPPRLAALCMALLAREPAARPTGAEILAQLTASPARVTAPIEPTLQTETQSTSTMGFFGREAELAQLFAAMREAETGSSVVLHVRGLSGTGKSALIEEFLGRLEARGAGLGQFATLVLRSRCYEREAMPFKALDGVIDALCRHLSQLDDIEVSNLVPGDVAALAQLFPVLERLRAVQRLMSSRAVAGAGAVQSRQRAEAALRELFRRLAGRQPVVVWIDDLQWGDLDSTGILSSWFQQGAELPMLFVLSYRSDEVSTSPCLQTLLSAAPSGARMLDVMALSPKDVAALCWSRLGDHTHERDALVSRIVREAQGSPFLAAQLATLTEAKLRQGHVEEDTITVARLIGQTAELLTTEARRLLRVLAVAGRPMAPKLAFRAAGIRNGGRELVHTLRGLQLVRTREVAGDRLLETAHDRVRESVQRQLDVDESRQLHASLLRALEFSGSADPDWLHQHALGAGERDAAFRYGHAAAERAMGTLAFARAAELFARCLELSEAPPDERCKLLQRLAAAHDYCGHGSRAADAYLEAVQLANRAESAPLLRLATAHLLCSGRFAEGEVLLGRLLATLGQRVPQSTWGLLLAVIWERLRLAARGLHYVRRDASEVPPALLARIDAFDALYQSTIALHPLRAALFMTKSLRWALEAGEPNRVLNALAQLWYTAVIGGKRAVRRAEALRTQAIALAAELDKPSARAVVVATDAVSSFMLARFHAVIPASREAERLYREHATSQRDANYQMRLSVVTVRLGALYATADFRTFIDEVTSAVAEARATEDVAAQLLLSLNETLLDHLQGRGDEAIARLERQRTQLPSTSFGFYHALRLVAVCEAACWTGRLDWGRAELEREWPRAVHSGMLRVPSFASLLYVGRLRLLVNLQLRAQQTDATLKREIARMTSTMSKVPGAKFNATVQSARLCHGRGDRDGAIALLRRALTEQPYAMELDRVRYLLGYMIDDDASRSERQSIEHALKAQGVDPRLYLGGFFPELYANADA